MYIKIKDLEVLVNNKKVLNYDDSSSKKDNKAKKILNKEIKSKKVKLGKYIFIGNYVMPERVKYNFGVKEVVPEHGILKVLPNTILIKRTLRKIKREKEAQENGGE